MIPGQHVVVVSQSHCTLREREKGLELRDTIQVMLPGPTCLLVHLFRVPIEESTVAGQMLKTGTGAINIDACRVAHQSEADRASATPQGAATSRSGRLAGKSQGGGERTPYEHKQGAGRWPPNLLLVHHHECLELGTKRVRGAHGHGVIRPVEEYTTNGRPIVYGKYAYKAPQPVVDQNGLETIVDWQCHPSCPVALLDKQSIDGGMHSAGHATDRTPNAVYGNPNGATWSAGGVSSRHGDTGGASRFFPQFKDLSELLDWLVRLTNTSEAR